MDNDTLARKAMFFHERERDAVVDALIAACRDGINRVQYKTLDNLSMQDLEYIKAEVYRRSGGEIKIYGIYE